MRPSRDWSTVSKTSSTTVMGTAGNGSPLERLRPIAKHWAREARRLLDTETALPMPEVWSRSYRAVVDKLGWDADRHAAAETEFVAVEQRLAEFPLARTKPFYDAGAAAGLLSDHRQPRCLQGLQSLRGGLPRRGAGDRQTGRAGPREHAPELGALADAPRYRRPLRQRDRSSTRASACCPRCCSRRTRTARWWGAMGPAWAAERRPRSTSSSPRFTPPMQPQVARQLARLDELIEALDRQARELLASGTPISMPPRGPQARSPYRWTRPSMSVWRC